MGYKYVFNPLSGAFDTVQDVAGLVPYTGATTGLNLGAQTLQTIGNAGFGTAPGTAEVEVRANDNAFIAPTGATVFSDTFTDASTVLLNAHTPTVGTSWSLALSTGGATYTVPAGAGYVRPTTVLNNVGCLYLANNASPAAAVEVSVRMPITVPSTNVIGLVFRYVDANNFYLLTISATVGNCVLYKKVAGAWTNLGITTGGAINGQTWRVRAVGTNIVVYAGTNIVKITSDASISAAGLCGLSAGTIGQNATDDTSTAWQVDDFTVTNYASSGGLVTNGINVTGDIQASGQILGHGQNSAIYPAISFAGDTNTGFYVSAADNLSIATGGSTRATFNSAGLSISGVCYTSAGSAAAPSHSFGADSNTGFYNPSADHLGVATAGALQWTFDSDGGFFTPNAQTPNGTFDIATFSQISNSGGNAGGLTVFNTEDFVYTRIQAKDYSNGAGIFGDGKLFFTSGEDYEASVNPGIDFNILATDYGTQTGNFNVAFQAVDDATGGSINLTAGTSNYGGAGGDIYLGGGNSTDNNGGNINLTAGTASTQTGGAVSLQAGSSNDTNGGPVLINAGYGVLDGGNVDIKGGYGTSNGGDVFISGGDTETADAGGEVVIEGGYDDNGGYGQVQIQTSPSGPIAVFGTGGSIQATTSVTSSTFAANSGTTVNDTSTFDGYTIAQVVKALRNYGWLA